MRIGIGRRIECRAHRRGVDEPRAVLETALQKVQGRAGVLPHGARRVLSRARGIRDPGEVQDGVASGDQVASTRVTGVDADRVLCSRALRAPGP
jgi:hypothetical protein